MDIEIIISTLVIRGSQALAASEEDKDTDKADIFLAKLDEELNDPDAQEILGILSWILDRELDFWELCLTNEAQKDYSHWEVVFGLHLLVDDLSPFIPDLSGEDEKWRYYDRASNFPATLQFQAAELLLLESFESAREGGYSVPLDKALVVRVIAEVLSVAARCHLALEVEEGFNEDVYLRALVTHLQLVTVPEFLNSLIS